MKILFPSIPFEPKIIESDYEAEYAAAKAARFSCGLFDHELVVNGDINGALQKLTPSYGEPVLPRSWMMTGYQYRSLHNQLAAKGWKLVTSPEAYEEAHYLPFAYRHIRSETARSAWIEDDSEEGAWQLYQEFSSGDAIIKDWVKSAKTKWHEGCFIPAGTERERFGEIYRVFRKDRDKLFERGIVIREFLEFRFTERNVHGAPKINETRILFWRGSPVTSVNNDSICREMKRWRNVARRFKSDFISIDIAPLNSGELKIVEVGDGGVSGLPEEVTPSEFYARLQQALTAGN